MRISIYDIEKLKDSIFHVSRTITEHSMVGGKDLIEIATRDLRNEMADFLARKPEFVSIVSDDVFTHQILRIKMQIAVLTVEELRNLLEEAFKKGINYGRGIML